MKTIEITISIPIIGKPQLKNILSEIAEAIEDRMSECDSESQKTAADRLGFGSGTITLTSGKHVEEICF